MFPTMQQNTDRVKSEGKEAEGEQPDEHLPQTQVKVARKWRVPIAWGRLWIPPDTVTEVSRTGDDPT